MYNKLIRIKHKQQTKPLLGRCKHNLKVLFWNTYKNENINSTLCELVNENCASIVVLAEYTANIDELINALLSNYGIEMHKYNSLCERITIIGSINDVEVRFDDDHTTIQVINKKDILCCTHLNSKIYSDNEAQREIMIEQIIREICSVENELDSENTTIVGDFNINPYDSSCVDARYFHSLPV